MGSNIKVVEKQGEREGKKLVVLVGVHGNEVCGVKATDLLLPKLKINSGKVTFIYANLKAIKQNKRFVEQNLNRCFFKKQLSDIKQSLEGKTAEEIIPYLDKADALLDIHASLTKDSVPFVICDESNIETAKIFNAEKIVCNIDKFHPGSTDSYMNLQNKPGFCFECGYYNDTNTQNIAKKAIISYLTYYGCIESKIGISKNKPLIIKIIDLYKNKYGPFKSKRYFKDFEKMKEKTLIGLDGDKEVYVDKEKVVLFVRDRERKDEECFLVGEEF
ncbi:succinylglutamate desuccinylase/aspartoacylase family protein [Candidatus Pacearchaeota archaeon]|nr:succinylglutamate desuccinylase/aspartoacylase family protein [Candidatus Pacearchaeota archaeon]